MRAAMAVAVAWSAALALAAPARGQGKHDELELRHIPGPAPLGFGLAWKDGPVYGVDEPLKLRGRIGGYLYLDGGWVGGHATPVQGLEGELRRLRLYTAGHLYGLLKTQYKFELEFEDRDFFLNDAYLSWHPSRWLREIRVGYFEPPVSLDALISSSSRSLMERPAPVAAFASGRRLGAQVDGLLAHPDLTWALSVATVGQKEKDADASDSTLRGVIRGVWRPWHDEEKARSLLHVGLSLSHTLSGSGSLRYRSRPESFLTGYFVDTDEIPGDASLLALELAWRRGPLSFQGELFQSLARLDGGSHARLGGFYLQLGQVLTGEYRPYDRGEAIFTRVMPRRELAPRRGGWGALELTGRLSWLDLDDGPVRGGQMLALQTGLVWTLNRWVRVHADYVFAATDRDTGDVRAHILQSRLELRL